MGLARSHARSMPGAGRSFTRQALPGLQLRVSPRSAPVALSSDRFAQGRGVHGGVSHPAFALASAVGLGLLSPRPRGCADPSASRGPSLTSLQWCLLTGKVLESSSPSKPLGAVIKMLLRMLLPSPLLLKTTPACMPLAACETEVPFSPGLAKEPSSAALAAVFLGVAFQEG